MNLFISQPMRGKTEDEILAVRNAAIEDAKKAFGDGLTVIDSHFSDADLDSASPMAFLAKSIECLSRADIAYFCEGWQDARGCTIEYECATRYGLKVIAVGGPKNGLRKPGMPCEDTEEDPIHPIDEPRNHESFADMRKDFSIYDYNEYRCKVCGKVFPLKADEVYTARDARAEFSDEEPTIYNAIDCLFCGCQNILHEKKRLGCDFVEDDFFPPDWDDDELVDDDDEDYDGSFDEEDTTATSPLTEAAKAMMEEKANWKLPDIGTIEEEAATCAACEFYSYPGDEGPCVGCLRAYSDRFVAKRKKKAGDGSEDGSDDE